MLKQLDVLIGFVTVLAVVSLLITIITQMFSVVLGLRGKYLAAALETMIHKIDPTINDQLQDSAQQLGKWILTHPVLSDSILPMQPNSWDSIPFVGWLRRRWRVASAIRPDELFQVLQDIAGVSPGKALAKQEAAQKAADTAYRALQERSTRKEIRTEAERAANLKEQEADEVRQGAITAATQAEEVMDAVAKQAASKDAAQQLLAARDAAKIATQTREIAKKAVDAVEDDAKAKQFALEAAMRAAAVKLSAALYVPPARDTASNANPAIHAVAHVGEVNTV